MSPQPVQHTILIIAECSLSTDYGPHTLALCLKEILKP